MEINDLPVEMLLMVHQRLRPSALKKAVLVSKLWRAVGEDSTLWEWCKVTVYSKEDISNLSVRRLQQISINPDNWEADDWQAFYRAIEGLSSLNKIDGLGRWERFQPSGLDLVEPGLFARSLAKLEEVDFRETTSYDHIQALFTEMSNSTRAKTFHLWSHNLAEMEPELFARVLSRLENLRFLVSNVTKEQVQAFFTELMNNSSLKMLDLCNEDIWSYLEPGLSARVLSKIEDVSLVDYEDGVSSAHLEALFTQSSFGTQLKRFGLNCNLSEIDPALFANSLSRLEELRLEYTPISIDQIQALFVEISLRTQMKKLAFEGIDLSQLDPELFARVMVRLENVFLSECDVTRMLEFFTEMSRSSHLKSLNIGFIDLSPLDPEVLAKGVTRVEEVILCNTDITNDQMMSLFSEMSQNTAMKKIDLSGNDLDLSSVAPEVLVTALNRLEEVKMTETGIIHDQAKAFFSEMSRNTQLKKLSLRGGNFSGIDPAILATAVTKVNDVSLRDCHLSADQVTSILTRVLEADNKLRKLNLSYIGGTAAMVNPEIVSKVEEKLKGELNLTRELNLMAQLGSTAGFDE